MDRKSQYLYQVRRQVQRLMAAGYSSAEIERQLTDDVMLSTHDPDRLEKGRVISTVLEELGVSELS